jgi:hypothetical protein
MSKNADEPLTSQPIDEFVAKGLRIIGLADGMKLPDLPRDFPSPESPSGSSPSTRTTIGNSSR